MTDLAIKSNSPILPTDKERAFFDAYPDDGFLPQIKLLQGTSGEIGQLHPQTGKPLHAQGDYYLSLKDRNMGREVKVAVLTRRAHAIMFRNQTEKVGESFNYESPTFQEIMNTPNAKDQSITTSFSIGDFLCWLPEQDNFATFFPGRKSSRPAGFEIIDFMTKPEERNESKKELPYTNCFIFGSVYRKFGPKFSAFCPTITPIESTPDLMPDPKLLESALAMFWKPVKEELNLVKNTAPVNR